MEQNRCHIFCRITMLGALCVKPQIHLTVSLTFRISSAFQAPRTGNREETEYLTWLDNVLIALRIVCNHPLCQGNHLRHKWPLLTTMLTTNITPGSTFHSCECPLHKIVPPEQFLPIHIFCFVFVWLWYYATCLYGIFEYHSQYLESSSYVIPVLRCLSVCPVLVLFFLLASFDLEWPLFCAGWKGALWEEEKADRNR